MIRTKEIRALTKQKLAANTKLAGITFYNAKIDPIMQHTLPAVSVYVENESADSRDHRNPTFVVTFELGIDVAIKGSVNWDPVQQNWADEQDRIETEVLTTLFRDEEWLDQLESVGSYTIDRELQDEGEYRMALSTITIQLECLQQYEADRLNNFKE